MYTKFYTYTRTLRQAYYLCLIIFVMLIIFMFMYTKFYTKFYTSVYPLRIERLNQKALSNSTSEDDRWMLSMKLRRIKNGLDDIENLLRSLEGKPDTKEVAETADSRIKGYRREIDIYHETPTHRRRQVSRKSLRTGKDAFRL